MNLEPALLIAFAAVQFVLFPIPIVTLFRKNQIADRVEHPVASPTSARGK